jgi:glycosyltransferase involved in cell wall biosynthesis
MHLAVELSAWLVALAWLGKLVETALGRGKVPDLTRPEYDRIPQGMPALTIIVPARDEAAGIGACLESLIGQDYPNLRVLAVDDRSQDGTAATMDALAAAHPQRLEVIHIHELPSGWLGKTHAMALGARRALALGHEQGGPPQWLLFTDGDIVFAQDILRRALAQAVATQADHFVVMPTAVVKTPGEAMVLSFLQVMGVWAIRPWKVADPRARDAIGVGAFNMIRADSYLTLGGFDATPMEILEDLTLGRRVKRAAMRQRIAIASGAVSVHWAADVGGILRGMTKNLFAVFRFRPLLLLGAASWFLLFCIGPVAFLALSGTRIPALLALASVAGLYGLSGRVTRISAWYALLFPVSAVLVVYSMLRSMAVTLRDGGVTWRGTFYSLAELRKHSNRRRMSAEEQG